MRRVAMIDVIRADITKLRVDAIVNAANAQLQPGGGVDGAIHRAAGAELHEELRRRYDGCPTGSAVVTDGYALPARYVIHAVGPIWTGRPGRSEDGPGTTSEKSGPDHRLLKSAYESAFARAIELGDVRSIAFPAISTGVYGFPKRPAAEIAIGVMREHEARFDSIIAAVFDDESLKIYGEVIGY
jgi:O-acetyl-ADP-ribose deacetylase